MPANRALAFASVLALASSVTLQAFADPEPQKRSGADDVARAERLFEDAKKLVREGRHAEACVELEESERLDSALGTQFNLADCYEHTGRLARAWALFTRVGASAKAAGKRERERAAVDRASALEPKLARVTVSVKDAVPGLDVRRDGVVWPRDAIGRSEVVDPGPVSITASAPGHREFATRFVIAAGQARAIEIPALVPIASAPAPAAAAPAPAPTAGSAPTFRESDGLHGQRVAAITVGAVGAVALAVGGVFGIVSLTKHDQASAACPDPHACNDAAAASTWTEATSAGTASTIGIVAGVVVLGVAGALWFTAPKGRVVASRPLGGDLVLRW
jgi:hypothetical protein